MDRPRRPRTSSWCPTTPTVSNNLNGFGTRTRLDTGVLGIVTVTVNRTSRLAALISADAEGHVERYPGYQEWVVPEFEVGSEDPAPHRAAEGTAQPPHARSDHASRAGHPADRAAAGEVVPGLGVRRRRGTEVLVSNPMYNAVADHIASATDNQRKALIESLIAEVKITASDRNISTFRIPNHERRTSPSTPTRPRQRRNTRSGPRRMEFAQRRDRQGVLTSLIAPLRHQKACDLVSIHQRILQAGRTTVLITFHGS
jgi:hypothetical protein